MDYQALKDSLIIPKLVAYGKVVALRRPGATAGYTKTWDPGRGQYSWTNNETHAVTYTDPTTTATDIAGHAVEVKYKQTEIDGVTVLISDRRFRTADLPTPTIADKLVVDSTVLNIVNVLPVAPGSVTLMWELQCRA